MEKPSTNTTAFELKQKPLVPNLVRSLGNIEKCSSGFSVAFERFINFISDRKKLVNGGVCYEIRVKPDKMMTRVNWNEVIQRGVGVVIDTGEEYDVRNLFGMKKSGKDQIS